MDPAKPAAATEGRETDIAMTYRSRVRTALAAGSSAATLLAGCGGGRPVNPVNTGPFGGKNYGGVSTCTDPLPPHSDFATSDLAFTNSGPAAVIDQIRLTHARGLRLLAAYTVPVTGQGGGYGDRTGYPPPQRDLPRGVLWSRRQRADGPASRILCQCPLNSHWCW